MKSIIVAALLALTGLQVFAEGSFRVFGDGSMAVPEKQAGMVRVYLYREGAVAGATSAKVSPVYVYRDGRLVAPLLRGGYIEMMACEGAEMRVDIQRGAHAGGATSSKQRIKVSAQAGNYFGNVDSDESLRLGLSVAPPGDAVRASLRPQIHAVNRANEVTASSCSVAR